MESDESEERSSQLKTKCRSGVVAYHTGLSILHSLGSNPACDTNVPVLQRFRSPGFQLGNLGSIPSRDIIWKN